MHLKKSITYMMTKMSCHNFTAQYVKNHSNQKINFWTMRSRKFISRMLSFFKKKWCFQAKKLNKHYKKRSKKFRTFKANKIKKRETEKRKRKMEINQTINKMMTNSKKNKKRLKISNKTKIKHKIQRKVKKYKNNHLMRR